MSDVETYKTKESVMTWETITYKMASFQAEMSSQEGEGKMRLKHKQLASPTQNKVVAFSSFSS